MISLIVYRLRAIFLSDVTFVDPEISTSKVKFPTFLKNEFSTKTMILAVGVKILL